MRTPKKNTAVPVIGLFASSLLFTACGSDPEIAPESSAVRPVKLITVEAANNTIKNSYPAVIEAATKGQLSFQVPGQVMELPITEAKEVKKGDLLAKLNQVDYQNQFDAANAQLVAAETEYQRAVRLFEQDAISKSILEQRKSTRDVAETQFKSAKKALKDTVLIAPFSGIIAKIDIDRLDTVQAGAPIITLLSNDGVQVTANVPATLVTTVNQRTDKSAMVILDSAEDTPIKAEFKEASLVADSSTQTFAMSFTFEAPEELVVLPGMNATLVLSAVSIEKVAAGVSVPIAAINADGSDEFTWVVDPESMKVSKRVVEVAEGVGAAVRVTKGLKPGDTIVGAGGAYLAEAMEVRPWAAE